MNRAATAEKPIAEYSLLERVKRLFTERSSKLYTTRKETGAVGEKLAVDLLEGQGYEIVQTNFRCRHGEIDIIARQSGCLVFVEVRTKRGSSFGTPEESVTVSKQGRLISLANYYLQTLEVQPLSWRIDIVAVELARDGTIVRLEHIKNAIN